MVELVKHAGPWTRRGIEVTLLDACDALYYSGMAPEYLGGVYTAEQVRIDLPHLCARSGVTFRRALVTALRSDGAVVTESGEEFDCDLAVFDIGGVNPHREQADGAVLTKPLHHIEALEQFVREALKERRDPQHLVVVGGGAAGVEVLLNVSARTHATRPGALRFTLVEPSSTLLPGFPSGMQDDVQQRLARRGVDVRFGAQATGVKGGQVVLDDGTRLSADRVLWATGTAGPPLFRASDLPVDEHGFLRVDDTLQCREAPWLFAAGDCVRLSSYPDLKKIGVHAVKQGPLLRTNVEFALHALQERRPLGDLDLHAFTPYPVAPLILSTGAPTGLAAAGSLWLRGGPLLRLKHFVDRRWMAKYSPLWRDRSFLHRLGREAAVGSAPPFVS
jgi:selenide,water dikinase